MSSYYPTQTHLYYQQHDQHTITGLTVPQADPIGTSPTKKSRNSLGSQGYHSFSELLGSSPPVPTPLLDSDVPTNSDDVHSSPSGALVNNDETEPYTDSSDDDRVYSGYSVPANSPAKSCEDLVDPFANSRFLPLPLHEQFYSDPALRKNRFGLFDVDRVFPCTTSNPCLLDSLLLKEKEEREQLFRELSSKSKFRTRRMQLLAKEMELSVQAHALINNALHESRFVDADV